MGNCGPTGIIGKNHTLSQRETSYPHSW
jgi:hypothetical protein